MSTQQRYELVPEWSQGDRLRKARSLTGMTVAEFAKHIGVSDRTINNAEGDKRAVRQITLNAWALATGVSREWLETGAASSEPNPEPPNPGRRSSDALDRLTEQKRNRTRNTRRYLPSFPLTPAAA
jgi:transcriptional regulator with XRE-family HTH domain